jgi:hypothetical protein
MHSDYINKLKDQILLEDGENKEGGHNSDSDSVIQRFRQEMRSMDIAKSEFIQTPGRMQEVSRKVSSEIAYEERMALGSGNQTEVKESPSTMKKVQKSANISNNVDQ